MMTHQPQMRKKCLKANNRSST